MSLFSSHVDSYRLQGPTTQPHMAQLEQVKYALAHALMSGNPGKTEGSSTTEFLCLMAGATRIRITRRGVVCCCLPTHSLLTSFTAHIFYAGCGGCPPGKHGYPSCQNNCHATCLTCASQSKTYCTSCKLDRKLMRVYQAFPALPTGALATGLGRAGTSGGYFSQAETVGLCEHIDTATDAPFCYPPKDVVYAFSASGKEMSLVCTKGNVVKFTHQVFWWYFVPSMGQKAQESVIAAAGGIATPSNWRRIIALAHCRCAQ